MRIGADYLILEVRVKSVHDRYDDYKRGNAYCHTEDRDEAYERYEFLFALCGEIP